MDPKDMEILELKFRLEMALEDVKFYKEKVDEAIELAKKANKNTEEAIKIATQ